MSTKAKPLTQRIITTLRNNGGGLFLKDLQREVRTTRRKLEAAIMALKASGVKLESKFYLGYGAWVGLADGEVQR